MGVIKKMINPVYKKELKQAARMKRTAILILFYNAALALFGLFAYYVSFNSKEALRAYVNFSEILTIYVIITIIEFALLLFLVPALTAGAVAGEREKQTLNILLTTQISPAKIVSGKLLASISIMLLLAVSSLPIISIVFSIGGLTLFDIIEFMILLVVTAVYIGSMGIFFSCLCKKTTAATVCSYSCMLFLTAGTGLIYFCAAVMYNSSSFGSWEYSNMLWYSNKLGGLVYLLLLNPLVTYITMIREQAGFFNDILNGVAASGNIPLIVSKHWLQISMAVQLLISVFVLILSARKLNPLKK